MLVSSHWQRHIMDPLTRLPYFLIFIICISSHLLYVSAKIHPGTQPKLEAERSKVDHMVLPLESRRRPASRGCRIVLCTLEELPRPGVWQEQIC